MTGKIRLANRPSYAIILVTDHDGQRRCGPREEEDAPVRSSCMLEKGRDKFMDQTAQFFFSPENRVAPLGIITLEGAEELSEKIDAHLVRWARKDGMVGRWVGR